MCTFRFIVISAIVIIFGWCLKSFTIKLYLLQISTQNRCFIFVMWYKIVQIGHDNHCFFNNEIVSHYLISSKFCQKRSDSFFDCANTRVRKSVWRTITYLHCLPKWKRKNKQKWTNSFEQTHHLYDIDINSVSIHLHILKLIHYRNLHVNVDAIFFAVIFYAILLPVPFLFYSRNTQHFDDWLSLLCWL